MVDNPKVNIYIETSVHGPAQHGGCYMYLIEYTVSTGEPATLWKVSEWTDKKENELTLEALAASLARLKASCVITLFTSCQYVHSAVECGWMENWRYNNWQTAAGKEIRNRSLWEKIEAMMAAHLIFATRESHSYKNWMQMQLKGEKHV